MSPTVNSPAPTASQESRSVNGAQGGGDSELPPQRHAGAVGYGPEYHKGVTTGEKLEGLMDEAKGKILRKPDVTQHGRDLRTGELKRRQEEEDNPTPLQSVEEPQQQQQSARPDVPKSDSNQHAATPPGIGDTTHPTEQGRYQQASSVAPEGEGAETPGDHAYRQIG